MVTYGVVLVALQVAAACGHADLRDHKRTLRAPVFLQPAASEDQSSVRQEADASPVKSDDPHATAGAGQSIVQKLLSELYNGQGPWPAVASKSWHYKPDHAYPHSNLRADVVKNVLNHVDQDKGKRDVFWLECGSFVGNSAITTLKSAHEAGHKISFIADDPFTGDVNMWAWNKGYSVNNYDFLHQPKDGDGQPHIYEAFMSNIKEAGFDKEVLPIRATSTVGMKLLQRLNNEKRLDVLPDVIYLDSAHEKDETLMELNTAFGVLRSGGTLLGDDWGWDAVRGDVTRFAQQQKLPRLSDEDVKAFGEEAEQPVDGVILVEGQWVIHKK